MPDRETMEAWIRRNEAARTEDRRRDAKRSMSARLEEAVRLSRIASELEGDLHREPDEFPFDPLDPAQLAEGGNFVLITRLGRLDVMQWVPGIPGELAFEHLDRNAVDTALGGHRVRVCSREDLITMKRAAGRPQDLLDLEELGA